MGNVAGGSGSIMAAIVAKKRRRVISFRGYRHKYVSGIGGARPVRENKYFLPGAARDVPRSF